LNNEKTHIRIGGGEMDLAENGFIDIPSSYNSGIIVINF